MYNIYIYVVCVYIYCIYIYMCIMGETWWNHNLLYYFTSSYFTRLRLQRRDSKINWAPHNSPSSKSGNSLDDSFHVSLMQQSYQKTHSTRSLMEILWRSKLSHFLKSKDKTCITCQLAMTWWMDKQNGLNCWMVGMRVPMLSLHHVYKLKI